MQAARPSPRTTDAQAILIYRNILYTPVHEKHVKVKGVMFILHTAPATLQAACPSPRTRDANTRKAGRKSASPTQCTQQKKYVPYRWRRRQACNTDRCVDENDGGEPGPLRHWRAGPGGAARRRARKWKSVHTCCDGARHVKPATASTETVVESRGRGCAGEGLAASPRTQAGAQPNSLRPNNCVS